MPPWSLILAGGTKPVSQLPKERAAKGTPRQRTKPRLSRHSTHIPEEGSGKKANPSEDTHAARRLPEAEQHRC